MKNLLKNSALVLVLAFLLVLPMIGFGFIKENDMSKAMVLGIESGYSSDSLKKDETNKDMLSVSSQKEIVDQIGIKLNLSTDRVQKFYGVIPEKYLSDEYQIIAVVPQEYKEMGMYAEAQKNELNGDVSITLPQGKDLRSVDLILVVLK